MTSTEEREKRRKRLRRDAIAKDLHSEKYRQRVVPNKKRKKKHDRLSDKDLLSDNGGPVDNLDDPIDWS